MCQSEGKKRKNICILTSVHPPFDTRIFHKEARSLSEAGYDVTLVAPHSQDEEADGVHMRAVPQPRSRFERMLVTTWKVWRAALAEKADVYHFHDPELLIAGLVIKILGHKVIYDVHEDLPRAIMGKEWIRAWIRRPIAMAAQLMEATGAFAFDAISAATPAIARRFPAKKTIVIQNFPPLSERVEPGSQSYMERDSVIAYVGVISVSRGLREMVDAITLLPESLSARLVIAGIFSPPELESELGGMTGRVVFLGWQPRLEIRKLLAKSKIGLVIFHPLPNHTEAQPNKLFEYMSCGIPVIASDFPLWRELVGGSGCGLLVDPFNAARLAEAISWLLQHPEEAEVMGKRGLDAVTKHYNWDTEAQKLIGLYRRLAL